MLQCNKINKINKIYSRYPQTHYYTQQKVTWEGYRRKIFDCLRYRLTDNHTNYTDVYELSCN